MNKVFTYCLLNGNCTYELVSGYFDGHDVPRASAIQVLSLRRKTPWFCNDVLLTIARHLWSMREDGQFRVLLHSPLTGIVDRDAERAYVIAHHKAVRALCDWAQTEHVYFMESNYRHQIREAIVSEEPNVECFSHFVYMTTFTVEQSLLSHAINYKAGLYLLK